MSEMSTLARLGLALFAAFAVVVGVTAQSWWPDPDSDGSNASVVAIEEVSTTRVAPTIETRPSTSTTDKFAAEPVDVTFGQEVATEDPPPTEATESTSTTTAEASTTTKVESTTTTTTVKTTSPPAGDPVLIKGVSGQVISGLVVSNPSGPCIRVLDSSNVTIKNSKIGPCGGRAVDIQGSSGVAVEGSDIAGTDTGIYALSSSGISIVGNTFKNAGRNFVQFDKVTGGGNKVVSNSGSNALGGSNAEDFISVYKSSGTSGSPIEIRGNNLRNGGPSSSGSGIMLGDNGGSHIVVRDNVLTNPGQVGIGVAGGTSISVLGNKVFSAAQPWSNVGIYVWNQSSGSCGSIEVRGNSVEWYKADGKANPKWDGGGCGSVAGWDDNNWNADLG